MPPPAPARASARSARLCAAALTLLASCEAVLPAALDPLCLPAGADVGCYADAPNRTFPVAASTQPGDPFHANMTRATCAYLCHGAGLPLAGLEAGSQCFCAATAANATAYLRPAAECNATCAGNALEGGCGGAWRVALFAYECSAWPPAGAPLAWLDASLPAEARADDLVARLPPAALVTQLTQNGGDVYAPGVQLPAYIVSQECLAGYDGGPIYIAPPIPSLPSSSAFPQPVNLGQTFDAELVRSVASAIADEARAGWVHYGRPSLTCMSPNLNVARDPRWGRNVESFGEDPTLIAALGAAYVAGLQHGLPGDGGNTSLLKIASIPKHLGAYSVECYGPNTYPNCGVYRSFFDAAVDDVDLRETYLPGWRAAVVEQRAQGVMASYNAINGVPNAANGALLRGILEGEWQAPGLVISDADGVAYVYTIPDNSPPRGHLFATSLRGAAVAALLNGTTVSLEDTDPDSAAFATQLLPALAAGEVALSDLRAAARRALLPRFRVGLYDPPASVPWNAVPASVIEGAAAHALARRAAAASYVLLKNDGDVLPLRPAAAGGPAAVAVVGAAANCTACILGRYTGEPRTVVTHWQGVAAAAAAAGATAVFGGADIAGAVAAVAAADVGVVLLTGEPEGESMDRQSLGIPAGQLALLAALAAQTATPLIVGVVSGGAVDLSPALALAGAALALGTGGMEAGAALGDILWGAVNPSAALATTMHARSWEDASDFLDMGMRSGLGRTHRYLAPAADAAHVVARFGAGLSYTTWAGAVDAVSPPTISAAALTAGATVNVSLTLANRGEVAGDRVVLLFLRRADAPAAEAWPVQWLARAGVALARAVPARSQAPPMTVAVSADDLSRWDASARTFVVRPGVYTLALRDEAAGGAAGPPLANFTVL